MNFQPPLTDHLSTLSTTNEYVVESSRSRAATFNHHLIVVDARELRARTFNHRLPEYTQSFQPPLLDAVAAFQPPLVVMALSTARTGAAGLREKVFQPPLIVMALSTSREKSSPPSCCILSTTTDCHGSFDVDGGSEQWQPNVPFQPPLIVMALSTTARPVGLLRAVSFQPPLIVMALSTRSRTGQGLPVADFQPPLIVMALSTRERLHFGQVTDWLSTTTDCHGSFDRPGSKLRI